jgi:hypothetical protein
VNFVNHRNVSRCLDHQADNRTMTEYVFRFIIFGLHLTLCYSSSQAGMEVGIVANGGILFFTIIYSAFITLFTCVRRKLIMSSVTQLTNYYAR